MQWRLRFVAACSRPDRTRLRGPWQRRCGVALALLLFAGTAWASETVVQYQRLDQMHHTAWTARDGLIGRVGSLAQTQDGYLWVGTDSGLYRFDGVEFERFTPAGGTLPAVAVNALVASSDGGLWVGYSSGFVAHIDVDGAATTYGQEHGLPVGNVRSLAEDHEGRLWAALTGGLALFDGDRWHTIRLDWNYPSRSAYSIYTAADGTLWAGGRSPSGVFYLPKGSRRFERLDLEIDLFAFVQLEDGALLLSNAKGSGVHEVRREVGGAYTHRAISGLIGHPLVVDRDGGVWFMTGFGVKRMNGRVAGPEGETPSLELFAVADGLSGRVPNDLLLDREGNVWSATDTGLDRFRRRNVIWKREERVSGAASLVADRDNVVWGIQFTAPALWRVDDGTAGPVPPLQLSRGFRDPEGSLWLTGGGTFLRWTAEGLERVAPPDEIVARGYIFSVIAAAGDRQGRLWASVNGIGQFHLRDGRWTFVPILPGREDWTATRAHVDDADRVWLAYTTEVASVDEGRVRIYSKQDGLDVGPVLAIGSRDSRAWIGAEMGLAVEGAGRFHAVRTSDALDFGTVAEVLSTPEGMWLNAAIGIVFIPDAEARRLLRDPSYPVRVQVFDLVSDLPEALIARRGFIASSTGADGVVWFLTDSGIAKVDPRQIVRNTAAPPVAIRAVVADDRRYGARGVITLPPRTRTIRIDYTALSLTIPERVRFRYRLDGWEDQWHDAGTRRSVFYTDLKPGHYALRVLASNNDGVWNEEGAMLAFVVAPAWYQTWWFTGLVVTAMAGAVVALYRLRVRRVSAALSARFDERLAERTRIARELHDTLLQTVQGSKMVADNALDHADDPSHLRGAMERLSEWLGRGVDEGRAALNSLRASTVEVNDLAESLRRAADDPARPSTMAVNVDVRGQSRHLHPIVRDEIYRIAYEAIRNAYAHSGATRLDVVLEYGRDLTLRVADNGGGIDPSVADRDKRGHFGLPGMHERAANISATLDIATSTAGTLITLAVLGRSVYRT